MNDHLQAAEQPSAISSGTQPVASSGRRWRRIIVRILLVVVIFGSGAVVGAGIALIAVRHGIIYGIHHPKEMPARIAHRLRYRLDLSDRQTQQVEQILAQRQVALQRIRRRYQPEVERELDLLEQQVGRVLTPGQRQRWERIIRAMRATWIPELPAEPDGSD